MSYRRLAAQLRRAVVETLEHRALLAVNVTTWHNDAARTGLNPNEQILTPSNVNNAQFGKVLSYPITGQVYAQPLYVADLNIAGLGTRDVVFVATQNNDVYAFDANSSAGVNGGLLWHVNLGTAATTPSPFIGFRYGPYRDVSPQVGITGTPVIDLASGTMYLDAFTNDVVGQDVYSHHIHALDIRTGQHTLPPKLVTASVPGNGVGGNGTTVTFAANRLIQRTAMTMFNGVLYSAYAAYADTDPYHGWMLGYDPATLNQVSVLNTTPNRDPDNPDAAQGEGGIWQSGAGLSSDGSFMYAETGNGDYDPAVGAFSDSVLKIAAEPGTNINGSGLRITDYFTPFNEQQLADADADLGSAGAVVLPDQPGAHPHLLATIGKQGIIYLLDRDNLGQYNATFDNVVQKVSLGRGFWGTPAYFNNSLYYHAVNDVLKRFSLSNGLLSAASAAQSTINYPTWPGATPSVTANGTANGIIWEVQFETGQQILHAYDATTLVELFNSNQNATRDKMGGGVKFISPTIADGRVFVGSSGALSIYGLIEPVTQAPVAPTNLAAVAQNATTIKLTWVDDSDNESGFKIERSADGVNFTQIDLVGVDMRSYVDASVNPNTKYYYRIRATNVIGDSAYTAIVNATTPASTGASNVYKFDASSGTAVADSQNANNGVLAGATLPTWVAGRTGNALSFSGNGTYNQPLQSVVDLDHDLSPILGSTSTLVVWVKTTQSGNGAYWQSPAITGVDQGVLANDISWGVLDRTGRVGLHVGDAGGVYSSQPINDGQWHNIAMTRDAVSGRVQIYVDGALNATHVLEAGNKTTPFNLIGALSVTNADGVTFTGANHFNGQLDDLRIYNTVLGASEIAALARVPEKPIITSATVAAGPVAHLVISSPSSFAENIEIYRKVGINGAFTKIATLPGVATIYDDTTVAAGTSYYYYVKAVTQAGSSLESNTVGVTPPVPTIIGIYTFYNESKFDGQNGSSNLTDRTAIATDKQPLFPGQTATFASYTSYSKGLTGIIIDVADMDVLPRIDDLEFRVGNDNSLAGWTQAPTPSFINTYPGRGVNASTQITIIWDDNVIQNQWLQVRVLAQPHLGLAHDTVFYFGNAIGETGDSPGNAIVTSNDASRVSANPTSSAGVTNLFDIDRDGLVNATDVNLVNAHLNDASTALKLISLGSAPTVATPASSSPNPVTGTTANVSVLGADNAGESNLNYTWALIGTPPAPVLFSINGTNAAKNTVATFMAAGTYTFRVTITDASGFSVESDVVVQVNQVAGSITVTPPADELAVDTSATFVATQRDQFGNPMTTQPTFSWSVVSGGGSVTAGGVYTASSTPGIAIVRAAAGGSFGNTSVTSYYDVLAWYPADASGGATLDDASTSNLDATLTGAYSFGGGVSGNALSLTGGYAMLPTNVVGSLNDFTIATWVKVTTLAPWARVFDFGSGQGVYMFFAPQAADSGNMRFAITTGSNGGEQKVDGPAMQTNTWTHIAITLSGDTATLYVNGIAVGTNEAITLHPTNLGATTQNYLGKSQWADPALQGSIDEFRIYPRALSAGQIAKLAKSVGVVNAAAAAPSPVTGTTTALSALGVDRDGTESGLIYTWATTGTPPAPVSFSANGTNAAKNTTAAFSAAGAYNFLVTITNPAGLSVTSSVSIVVNQVLSGTGVSPDAATLETGMTLGLTFGNADQFGDPIGPALSNVNWSVTSGTGTVSSSGVYIAPAAAGSATVTASATGAGSDSANIIVVNSKRAWYQANGTGNSNTLTDASGQGFGGTTSGPHTWSAGIAGNALNLNGGFVNLPNGIVDGLGDITIATWVRVNNLNNWARIFDFGNNTDSWMFLTPSAGGTNELRFSIKTAGNAAQDLNGPTMTTNTWTHVAITLSGNVGTMYVNGVAVATNPGITYNPDDLGSTVNNYLGESQFGADPLLSGSIDDFRIYTRALAASEIAQLVGPTIVNRASASASPITTTSTNLSVLASDVTRGEAALTYTWATVGTPPAPVNFSANGTNAAKNTTATFTRAGTYNFIVTVAGADGADTTSTLEVVVQSVQTLTVTPLTKMLDAGTTQQFTASVQDQFGTLSSQPTVTWSVQSGAGSVDSNGLFTAPSTAGTATVRATSGSASATATLQILGADKNLAWYKFNESSGTVAADNSGLANNANLTGAYSFTAGTSNNALTLSGGAANLPTGIISSITGDFTIATWVRLTTVSTWSRIFDFGTGTGAYMFLTPAAGGTGRPRFAITTTGNGGEQVVNSTSVVISPNTWIHIAISLTGNTATLYINGQSAGSASITLRPAQLGNTTQNFIGDSQFAADPSLNGSVDDFRIYSRSLSSADIAALASQPRFAYVFGNRLYVDFQSSSVSLGTSGANVTVTSGATTLNFAQASFSDILVTGATTNDVLTVSGAIAKPLSTGSAPPLALTVDGTATYGAGQADGLVHIHNLSLGPAGRLEIADNDLLVEQGSYATIRSRVLQAFANLGPGIASASDGSQILALFDNSLVGATQWNGQTIGPSAIVGKYTYFGDANLDGQVTGDDYTVIDANLNTTPAAGLEWLSGDMNLDGMVTGDDYTVIDANLGLGVSNPLSPSGSTLLTKRREPDDSGLLS